jgi:nucleoside-diphosphate-sugar epimerase
VTILVAGATGPLGRALVPRLIAGGHRVRTFARDAATEDDLLGLVRGCDAVVHIATTITESATRLLDAALASDVSRYVQQSDVIVYRDGGDAWLDEHAPLDDSARQTATCGPAIELETMIRNVAPQSLAWTILRGGAFVGAGTNERVLIERLRAGDVAVAGDGSNYLSLVNVADMAAAIDVALELAPPGSTFNIVDEPLRYGDYVDALADLIGVARPRRAPALPRPPSRRCTNHAARTVLGWMPRERIWPYGRFDPV